MTDADGFSNTATVQRKLDRAKALFSCTAQDFLEVTDDENGEVELGVVGPWWSHSGEETEEELPHVVESPEQKGVGPVDPAAAKEARDELTKVSRAEIQF